MLKGGFIITCNVVIVHLNLGEQSSDKSLGNNLFAVRVLSLFDEEISNEDTGSHIYQISCIEIRIAGILFLVKICNCRI